MLSYLNSYFSKTGKKIGLVIGIVFILLMWIPFPEMVVQVMMGFSFVSSVVDMCICIGIKNFDKKRLLPVVNLFVCLFIFITDIQATRIILSNPDLKGFFKIGENLITNPVVAVGLDGIYTVFVAILLFVFIRKMNFVAKISARISLDSIPQKLFDLDNQLCNQKLTMQESEFYKEQIRNEVDFYSEMDDNFKFIKGITECITIISVVQLFGACLITYSRNQLNIESAVIRYSRVTCLTSLFFLICMIIIIIGFDFCIKGANIRKSFDNNFLTDYQFANYNFDFAVSLGSELLTLMNKNDGILIELLKNLREEINIPQVYVREDKKLGETEFIVSWKGKIIRGVLDLREGDVLCATEIVETVRKMWEG